MKDRFWRLLGACEMLVRSETAALAGRDFAGVGRTQQVKSAILIDLAIEANCIQASSDSQARARLARLLECTRKNRLLLARMMEAAAEELRKVRSAANQLHTLRAVYKSGCQPLCRAFSAHG
jgi:hypothetical protein